MSFPHWANPHFLWLIPLILLWAVGLGLARDRFALPYSAFFLLRNVLPQQKMRAWPLILKTLALLFFIIALARPQKMLRNVDPPKPVVDIVLCLDTSYSMSALDFDPQNRLEAARSAAEEFIKGRVADRIGLVVFGGKAITQCPLTLDHATLIDFLRLVPINATGADGTAVGTALALAATQLESSPAKSRVIILLTDGRSNAGNLDPLTAAESIQKLGIKIYAIGAAVPGGGLIAVEDPIFGRRMARMAEDLDEGTLSAIAKTTGGQYYRVTSAERLRAIYSEIDRLEKTRVTVTSTIEYQDRYFMWLALGAIFLLIAQILERTLYFKVP